MELIKKLEQLQDREGFVQALEKAETIEQFQELLQKHGVDVTVDEAKELASYAANLNKGELSEDDLDDVAGGAWYIEAGKFVVDQIAKWFFKKLLDKATGW